MPFKVYLAGPIAGLNYANATSWREYAKDILSQSGINGYSPMRSKEFLSHIENFSKHPLVENDPYKALNIMSTTQGIIGRDSFDVRTCDLVLANFVGATSISMGTIWELGLAFGLNKPVVVAMEDEGNPNDHGLSIGSCRWRVKTLEEALIVTKSILLP